LYVEAVKRGMKGVKKHGETHVKCGEKPREPLNHLLILSALRLSGEKFIFSAVRKMLI